MFLKSTNFIAHFISNSMTKTHVVLRASYCFAAHLIINYEWERELKENLFWSCRRHFQVVELHLDLWSIVQPAPVPSKKRSSTDEWIGFVDNEMTDDSFRANDKTEITFSVCDSFIKVSKISTQTHWNLSARCNFFQWSFLFFYHFTTSNVLSAVQRKLSTLHRTDLIILLLRRWDFVKWISFQTITKHRIGFMLCFRSNGIFLWLSFITSLSKCNHHCQWGRRSNKEAINVSKLSLSDKSCVLTMKIGSLNSTLTYLSLQHAVKLDLRCCRWCCCFCHLGQYLNRKQRI